MLLIAWRKSKMVNYCSWRIFFLLIVFDFLATPVQPGADSRLDASTLTLVQVLFRHGDRSPITTYPTDLYNETDWPQGYGQLSTRGMQQEHSLGQFFRKSYVDTGFMDTAYNRLQVHAQSTNFDRTLMSAYSMLSGLFPPGQNQTWDQTIPWQPIPVHTQPRNEDKVMITDLDCPRYNEMAAAYRKKNKQIFADREEKYKDLLEYIGKNINQPPTLDKVGVVIDPLYIENLNNMSLPAWVTNDTLAQILVLRDVTAMAGMPHEIAYLKGGPLLGDMLEHMKMLINGSDTQHKLYVYSGHDSTVGALLQTIDIFNHRQPPYTACVIVELHNTPDQGYVVQVSFRNDSSKPPYILHVPNCGTICPYKQFVQLMQQYVPADITAACKSSVSADKTAQGVTIVVAVLASLLLLGVLVGIAIFCLKRTGRPDTYDYAPVAMELE